jgi:MerR family transcriptional regulator, copper efflux regulator
MVMTILSIGQVAKRTMLTVETIRFYEKKGLIIPPQRSDTGYRLYPSTTIKRVLFIQHAKKVGFTLKEIKELLYLRKTPGTSCTEIKLRSLDKLAEIERKIEGLKKIKQALSLMLIHCSGSGDLSECPILETLDFGDKDNE